MGKTDKRGKIFSLSFAILATVLLIGVGIALSYRQPLLAALLLIIAICLVGTGFIVKAKLRR